MKNFIILLLPIVFCSCAVIEFTGDTVEMTGKIIRTGIRTTGTLVTTTGKVAYATGKAGKAGIDYFTGTRKIQLERVGNSYFAVARLNRKYNVRLLVDTGATHVQISERMARYMGIKTDNAMLVRCTLADGSTTYAKLITLKEMSVGGTKVKNVEALVLFSQEGDDKHGLLGMSFLDHFRFQIDPDKRLLLLKHKVETME